MSADPESIAAALLAHLESFVKITFTGDTTDGSAVIENVSSTDGLIANIPVFAEGVPGGVVIASFDVDAATVTLSQAIAATGTAVAFKAAFINTGRRATFWTKTAEQPALFVRHTADEDSYAGEGLQNTDMEFEVWIYSRTGADPDAIPDTGLNALASLVRSALQTGLDDRPLTLPDADGNPIVYRCRIEGRSEYDPGDLDMQGKAVIPVRVRVPAYP